MISVYTLVVIYTLSFIFTALAVKEGYAFYKADKNDFETVKEITMYSGIATIVLAIIFLTIAITLTINKFNTPGGQRRF